MPSIGICDDEREVLKDIAEKIQKTIPQAKLKLYSSGEEVLSDKAGTDILFLDIQMPGTDGMTVARRLREYRKGQILVFLTALEEYVFQAFDVKAFHYLVKPFPEEKFQEVLLGAVRQWEEERVKETAKDRFSDRKQLLVKTKGACIRVFPEEILYAEVYNRKVILHKRDGNLEYYKRLSELEAELGEDFARVHRSYLVRLECVEKYNAQTVFLEDKSQIPMAKQKYAGFVKKYLDYMERMQWKDHPF